MHDSDRGLGTWLPRRAATSPSSAAVLFGDRSLTYAELHTRVGRLGAALAARGIAPGDRVAYLGTNRPEFLETLFATVSLGAIFVPLNVRLAPPELRHGLTDSGAVLLVHDAALAAAGSLAAAGTAVRELLEVGPAYEAAIDGEDAPAPPFPSRLDEPALIIYTSGTTGRPKGAVLTHGNLTWNAVNVLVDYDLASSDVCLMISPLFHVASLGMGALPALLKGATVLLAERFDAGETLRAIQRHGVTWVSGVPTTFQLMLEHPEWASTDLSTVTKLTCGGSSIPLPVLEAYELRGLAFTGGYGMTEASPGVTSLRPAHSRTKAGSAGQPHSFTEVRIASAGTGEIEVRGPNVMLGYWQNPEATSEAFTADGWLRTGDLGRWDDDGFLYIAGRGKELIISGGENIYPAEVELLIAELPGVTGVVVVGVPDDRWGEVPVAVVTGAVDQSAAIEHLSAHLARYKVPKRFVLVDELPRTSTGKVIRREVEAMLQ